MSSPSDIFKREVANILEKSLELLDIAKETDTTVYGIPTCYLDIFWCRWLDNKDQALAQMYDQHITHLGGYDVDNHLGDVYSYIEEYIPACKRRVWEMVEIQVKRYNEYGKVKFNDKAQYDMVESISPSHLASKFDLYVQSVYDEIESYRAGYGAVQSGENFVRWFFVFVISSSVVALYPTICDVALKKVMAGDTEGCHSLMNSIRKHPEFNYLINYRYFSPAN
ncbi:hypothetical protein H4219_005156 [Mycoemilia scoparia]|uniref:Uncharacterized protein n=1 Tax=Mycoemilia scoparia TaxID=417184 RepID=A0A9W7ZP16_9FUNG|nr:hypothetical protein H4219_005156 [Mycoemilia scoparia]